MPDLGRAIGRVLPRHGIFSTAAGRRVLGNVVALTAATFAASTLLVVGGAYALRASGALGRDAFGDVLAGTGAAALVVVIAFLLLPLAGRLSRVGDDVRLLELCDPGAPLLRELMDRAPGTFQHSIATGTIAEAVAREIGADPLVTRAGAYYHDIGKLVRPRFFVENQAGARNPHDSARPEQSAFIITAHVREGAEMARRARLPRSVVDIVEQHHGTSLVTYFYRKAAACDIAVDEAGFRYEGARPHTREAALVMLADASEAAGRCCADSGPEAIERAVRMVVGAKVDDGQLAESGMSPADVETSVAVITRILASSRHARVEYPDDTATEGDADVGQSQLRA